MSAETLVSANTELTSLPDIVMRLNDMVNDPTCTAADIGSLINQDTGLTARLLKIVNSPFYGFPTEVDTVSMAITIIGVRQLRDLVFSTCVVSKYSNIPENLLSPEYFWQHSIGCALAARNIASRIKLSNKERLFTNGMLHDIGKLIMCIAAPEKSRQLLELTRDTQQPSEDFEQAVFGFTHGEVGAAIIRKWRLPESFIEPIQFHQKPSLAERYKVETAIIHLANAVSHIINPDTAHGDNIIIDTSVWETLNLDQSQLEDIITEVVPQLQEIFQLIYHQQAA